MSAPSRSLSFKSSRLELIVTSSKWIIAILILIFVIHQQQIKPTLAAGSTKFYEGPGVFPAQILRDRGFRAEDHHVITKDKYRVRITRAWNPLIVETGPERPYGPPPPPCDRGHKDRVPLLLIHGILESFNAWVGNSFGAEPRDFSNQSLAFETLNESLARLGNEPSAKSLAILALNHGHEVWIMSRRGFPGSRTLLGDSISGDIGENAQTFSGPLAAFFGSLLDFRDLPQYPFSFDKKFWNYTFDQQAQLDVPQIVDYILDKTCRKQLSIVAHSAGGTLTLMSLSLYPDLNQKVQSAILWSPATALGHGGLPRKLLYLKWFFERFHGPVPFTFMTEPLEAALGLLCPNKLTQHLICERISEIFLGPSRGQARIRPEFISTMIYSSASHELAQFLQWISKDGNMHEYDYGSQRRNMIAHGHPEAQPYNVSSITLDKISFWRAASDILVTPEDVDASRKELRVPTRLNSLRYPFNHLGFFWHDDVEKLVVIPTLREIHQFSERKASSIDRVGAASEESSIM